MTETWLALLLTISMASPTSPKGAKASFEVIETFSGENASSLCRDFIAAERPKRIGKHRRRELECISISALDKMLTEAFKNPDLLK